MKHILEQAQQGKLEARAGQTIYLAFEISVNEVLNDVTEKVTLHRRAKQREGGRGSYEV